MKQKYICTCSYDIFIRNTIYDIDILETNFPKYQKVYLYNKTDGGYIFFDLYNNNDNFLCTKNNIVILTRLDIWREKQINKILEND